MTDEEQLLDAQHERTAPFLLAGFERRVLPRLAGALPAWVVPDHLSALGLLSSTWIAWVATWGVSSSWWAAGS